MLVDNKQQNGVVNIAGILCRLHSNSIVNWYLRGFDDTNYELLDEKIIGRDLYNVKLDKKIGKEFFYTCCLCIHLTEYNIVKNH